jgi:hypothetical protein
MSGVSWKVTKHTLHIKLGSKPVKQDLLFFNEEKCQALGKELANLLTAGFIKEVHLPY